MKSNYNLELVLQFPAASLEDYDSLISLEDQIIDNLGDLGKVDGHDCGVGEMNIFIRTNEPRLLFARLKGLPSLEKSPTWKAAYRKIGEDSFTVLHPIELVRFSIA